MYTCSQVVFNFRFSFCRFPCIHMDMPADGKYNAKISVRKLCICHVVFFSVPIATVLFFLIYYVLLPFCGE